MEFEKNKTHVTTSYTTGLTINMDHGQMKAFLTNISLSLIVQVRELELSMKSGCLNIKTKLPHYTELINTYCSGNPTAILFYSSEQIATLLFKFVQDCVENDTCRGLYLFYDRSIRGIPNWQLILQALDEYTELMKKINELRDGKYETNLLYNKYNNKFKELISNNKKEE